MSQTSISAIRPTDGSEIYPLYKHWKGIVPLPPGPLLWSVGGATIEEFLVVGDAWGQLISRFCPEAATVLEIGCGCGRATRVLMNNPWIKRYIGFDVIPANIEWCNNFIAPAWHNGTAEFFHYDYTRASTTQRAQSYPASSAFPVEMARRTSSSPPRFLHICWSRMPRTI